jgi:hypothetical protein
VGYGSSGAVANRISGAEAQAALKAVMEVLDVSGQDEAEPPEVRIGN